MRGSFGMGRSAAGGSGGGSGGGGMLKTVGRVVRTGISGEPLSSSSSSNTTTHHNSPTKSASTKTTHKSTTSKHALSLSSTGNNNNNGINSSYMPVSAAWPVTPYFSVADSDELGQWECVEDYFDDRVFGGVPSAHEVEHALLSLQQVIRPVSPSLSTNGETVSDSDNDAADVIQRTSSKGSDMIDWIEPSMQIYDQTLAKTYGWERVYDAFRLLQTDPSVQKMVVSLSSDRGVWDAVLNNDAVREVRDSYRNVTEISAQSTVEQSSPSDTSPNVLKWIYDNMKEKFLEIIENITKVVGGISKPLEHDKTDNTDRAFSEKLGSTFLLTVVVLLIVVVTRGYKT